MSDYITGVFVSKATAEIPPSSCNNDSFRTTLNMSREELTAYFDRCASGKQYYVAKESPVAG